MLYPLEYPGGVWRHPLHGTPVPKVEERNIEYRLERLEACEGDEVEQAAELQMCRTSWEYFVNTYVWTPQQMAVSSGGLQTSQAGEGVLAPFISAPVHDALHARFREAIATGTSLIVPKSRDMMATWWMLTEALWDWLFRPGATIILVSNKFDNVDGANTDALMPRIDAIRAKLPPWMVPHESDVRRVQTSPSALLNIATGAAINGLATTETSGVSGRRYWLGLDEAALNQHLEQVWDLTKDVAPTRLMVTTPYQPGFFRELRRKGTVPQFRDLLYYNHPLKGRGREERVDHDGTMTGKPGYKYIWTPWVEKERGQRTVQGMARQVFADDDVAGDTVFSPAVLTRLETIIASAPAPVRGDLLHDEPEGEYRDESIRMGERFKVNLSRKADGCLLVWTPLQGGRPPVDRYLIAADVATGSGSSNSVAKVYNATTHELAAQYVSASVKPQDYARELAMLGWWFYGEDGPALLGGEANGPGQIVLSELQDLSYPDLWDSREGKTWWYSNAKEKRRLADALAAAWDQDRVSERDVETINEAGDWTYWGEHGVGPARLRREADARATHGDRVVAAMIGWEMLRAFPTESVAEREVPAFSPLARVIEAQRQATARRTTPGL